MPFFPSVIKVTPEVLEGVDVSIPNGELDAEALYPCVRGIVASRAVLLEMQEFLKVVVLVVVVNPTF
jgi:hypothetical protein